MLTNDRTARQRLIDSTRMDDLAATAGRSAEALFRYLSRLDDLREANLSQAALADRAAEAELHTRVLLSAGMDALNELNDLGLLDDSPTDEELRFFNEMKLPDALKTMAKTFRERLPAQRWDFLETAGRLVEDVEVSVERHEGSLRSTITHSGQSTVFSSTPGATVSRVSTRAFFSDGPDRVYVPTSAIFSSADTPAGSVAGYNAAVGGLAFVREWVYRHARNAAELGPPARTGGGPVVVVIAVVLAVAAAMAAIEAVILEIICQTSSHDQDACELAKYFGFAAFILSGGSSQADSKTARQVSYGTNPQ